MPATASAGIDRGETAAPQASHQAILIIRNQAENENENEGEGKIATISARCGRKGQRAAGAPATKPWLTKKISKLWARELLGFTTLTLAKFRISRLRRTSKSGP